ATPPPTSTPFPYTTLFRSHSLDRVRFEGGACRPSEVEVRGVHGLGARIRWHEPEHHVCARKRLVDDEGIAVRALNDVDPLADMRSEEHTSELQSLAYLVCR